MLLLAVAALWQPLSGWACDSAGQYWKLWRKSDSAVYAVHPWTMAVGVFADSGLRKCRAPRALEYATYPSLLKFKLRKSPSSNAGWQKWAVQGHIVTADLCPSSKPLDTAQLRWLSTLHSPFPIALPVSGLWLRHHREELEWLQREDSAGHLRIQWVNHAHRHQVRSGIAKDSNFLLASGVSVREELLAQEREMLAQGLLPSPWVRLPGLEGDDKVMDEVRRLGLVPLGSAAFGQNGRAPRLGDVILVHANGNNAYGWPWLQKALADSPAVFYGLDEILAAQASAPLP